MLLIKVVFIVLILKQVLTTREAPAELHVMKTSLTSIIIKWKPIVVRHGSDAPSGYKILYKPNGGNYASMDVASNQTEAEIRNLESNTIYTIKVAGLYKDGNLGQFSEKKEARTLKPLNDPCDSNPCLHGGTCNVRQENQGVGRLYCKCAQNFTGEFCAVFMSDIPCHSPDVGLLNVSPNASSALSIYRSRHFIIQSDVRLNCKLSHATMFLWRVHQLGGENTPLISRNSSSDLHVTPCSLPVGIFLVQLTVSMIGTPVFGVSQGYFQVVSSPLVAFIAGGSKVARGLNRTLSFDASLSYDPDEESRQYSGLNFTWFCGLESPVDRNNSDEVGCYYRSGDKESVGHKLRVNNSLMAENTSYFITVQVTKDERKAEYTQEVFIVPGDPPELQIRCIENCDAKLNPSVRVALQGVCKGVSCHGNLIFKWTVLKDSNYSLNSSQWSEVLETQELISTRVSSKSFVTRPGVLTPDTRYKFIVTAQRPGGYRGYSEYHVTSNSPPTGGVCNVSPTSGVTLTTEFTFKCMNWQAPDLQLQYLFIYITNNNLLNVAYKGVKTSLTTKLPAGKRKNNFTIDFRVRVANIFGAYTEVRTPVQVLETSIEQVNLLDIVKNLTNGDESELNYLIQSGDVSRALLLTAAALSAIHVTAYEELKESEAHNLARRRSTMKSNIIAQLSAIPIETIVRVQQVSNLIASASSISDEVTVEAQKDATNTLEKMTLVLKVKSAAGESYDSLYDGAKSLVNGLGSVLRVAALGARAYNSQSQESLQIKASLVDEYESLSRKSRGVTFGSRTSFMRHFLPRRTERDADDAQLQARIHVESMLHSLKAVGSTILSHTLVGEEPKQLQAQAMSLLVFREEPRLLTGTVLSNKGNSFQLTSLPFQLDNNTHFVDSQMVTADFIPFSWHPTGARVTTAVSSLELWNSSGHPLNTRKVNARVAIKLKNLQVFINTSQSHYIGANRTIFYKINVAQPGMALMLKIRPESNKTEFVVTLKYGKRPSLSNSDFNVTIPDLLSCDAMPDGYLNCSRDPYMLFVNQEFVQKNGLGYYFVGLKAVSRVSAISRVRRCLKQSCVRYKEPPTTGTGYSVPQYHESDENYTIQVVPAACLYWNAEISQWTSEGCRVTDMTTQDSVHCSCNHLSAFGGQLLVAPTPIDFDIVFTELARLPESGNTAVIIAISCVFGIYLVLFMWARKYDKRDLMKVGESAVVGVPSPSSHFVEIQVSTGIWRNSGTTANVFIILQGELSGSRPFHLKHDSCLSFSRGSVISFILSIPDDIGPIKTVRVWHDNSGSNPSWFLNHVKVFDLFTKKQWNFMCFAWLAVDKGEGLIDRTLHCASATDKGVDFAVYVQNRIAEEFSDSHVWFSVAARPPRCRFTRVQRLSCCLALLLTSMLASAMFYQHGAVVCDTQGSVRMGRFNMNLKEFIIGVQSLFVIFPTYVLTVKLFAHTRSADENKQTALKAYAEGKSFSFPHWFVFVPWLLCFLLSTCAAAFVIFYSLQWGEDTSEQWLASVAMSILVDIFVMEPVQIIVVAFMLPHILNKGTDKFTWMARPADPEVKLEDIKVGGLSNDVASNEEVEIPKPLSEKQLRRARITRQREIYAYSALWNIVSYMAYLLILMIVCYGGLSKYGYLMTSSLKNTFGELNMISNYLNTWDWARDVLVPGLFEDGKKAIVNSSSPYIGNGDAVLVGMPRFRQLRVKEASCDVSIEELITQFNTCVVSYTSSNEEKTSFHETRWRLFPSPMNESFISPHPVCPSAWHYSSAQETSSLPLWSRLHLLNFYGEGGYLAELGYDKITAQNVISELNQFNWTDRFTSALILEFTVFNAQVNLFSVIGILTEFSPSGLVVSNHVIHTMQIYNIGGGYSAVTLTCQLLLAAYIVYFVVKETKKIIAGFRIYFSQFLNWVELTQTFAVIGFLISHIMKETELFDTTAKLRENTFQFISFFKGVLLQDLETVFISLLIFLNTLKLLYLLKLNSHVRHLFHVMKRSARELAHCSVAFAVFMFACIHVGYLLFGSELHSFSSPVNILQSLLIEGVVGGKVDYFKDCCTLIGPVYVTAIKVAVNLLCMSLFISILVYNYRCIRELSKGKFDPGHFMVVKVKELLGCVGDRPRENEGISAHDPPSTEIEEDILPEAAEILAKLDRMNHLINVLYADQFGEDLEMFSFMFDVLVQAKKSEDLQENCVDAQDNVEAAAEEDWVDAQE